MPNSHPKIDRITDAFKRQDYPTVTNLLQQLLKEEPNNPWGRLYLGRLYEQTGKPDLAEDIYRLLLRQAVNSKIATQARSGLQRLEDRDKQRRQEAIARASAKPENAKPGILIIEPVTGTTRYQAVQDFARIIRLDPHTAQMQLPTRYWRLQRLGPIGELQVYATELNHAGIPAFCVSLEAIQNIQVFQVSYFQAVSPQPTVVCQDDSHQPSTIAFDWNEVAQRVEGGLPIFGSVVDLDPRGRLERKEKTQDYARVCDLHLPSGNCLLRLCDRSYQFSQSVALGSSQDNNRELTNRLNWNNLINFLNHQLNKTPIWSDFTIFGQMALEQAKIVTDPTDFLGGIRSHINLFRRAETDWDPAFQLYSALVFLRNSPQD